KELSSAVQLGVPMRLHLPSSIFHLPSSIFHRSSQKPGPSVAISNNCPSGAEKLMLEKNGLPITADTSSSIERSFSCHAFNSSRSSALNATWFVCPTP